MAKSSIKATVAGAMILVSLAGCASNPSQPPAGPEFKSLTNPVPGTALVYIFRPYHEIGEKNWPIVFLNGKRIFELRNNRYTWLSLKPGKYHLTTERTGLFSGDWGSPISFEVKADSSYYVGLVISGKPYVGMIVVSPAIMAPTGGYHSVKQEWVVLDEARAQALIYTCRYLAPESQMLNSEQ